MDVSEAEYIEENEETEEAEVETSEYEEPEQPRRTASPKQGRTVSVVSIVATAAVCMTFLWIMLMSLDKRNKLYSEITQARNELSVLQSENVRLSSERDAKMNAKNVDEYAKNVLGMIDLQLSQINFIELQTEDIIYIPPPEENIWIKIKNFFSDCLSYLRG